MGVDLLPTPPADWEQRIAWPVQHRVFAEAARSMGYAPLYACEGNAAALVQTRGTWPLLGRVLGRAYVYVSNETPQFVAGLLGELARRGIPFARFGNTMWGLQRVDVLDGHPGALEEKFTFVLDTEAPEQVLWDGLDGTIRRAIRAAQKQGVTVREATTVDDLRRFYPVLAETGERILRRSAFVAPPPEFFRTILTQMVPAGQAAYYLAEYQGRCIGVLLNLMHRGTMLYYAGGSLREFSRQNAPSLMHWHAVRQCQLRGLARYDLGGCSPHVAPEDPRHGVFHYKQKWGGRLERFYNAEVYLSPGARAFQDIARRHIWPVYLRLRRRSRES